MVVKDTTTVVVFIVNLIGVYIEKGALVIERIIAETK